MLVYIVCDFIADESGFNPSLKVFIDKTKAEKYHKKLKSQHTSNWESTEIETHSVEE